MPKDRKLTYSDRQSQASREKKQSAQKKMISETSAPPTPITPKPKEKR
jgi:hypothetical protein